MIDVSKRRRPTAQKPDRWQKIGSRIDSAIFAVAPGWGEKRMAARLKRQLIDQQIQRLGHPAMRASVSRDSRFYHSRQSTDEQLQEDLPEMQHRSREMIQTNPHAAGAVEGRVAHEIGVGLACRPEIQPGDGIDEETARAANAKLVEVCRQWSDHGVDRQRQFSLPAMQRIAQRSYASYGECFLLLREAPYTGSIGLTVEIINPMRCETPHEFADDENVKLGIRYHPTTDQIVGYYFRKVDRLNRRHAKAEYEFVDRFDSAGMQRCCHIFEPLFPDQSRGLPWLMAGIPFLKDGDDFHEAELINKQVEACLGVFIKTGKSGGSPLEIANGAATDETETHERIEELFPGAVNYIGTEDDVDVVDPSRPGGTFAPFIEHTLRAVAAAGNYPYELLAKNFFRTTYSSGRLAMLDGKLGFDMRRDVLVQMGMKPIWRRVVSDAFFHGHMDNIVSAVVYLANRNPWERHNWGGDSFGSIDPEKEKKAHKIGLETGQSNLAMIAAEDNRDWRDVMKQRDVELREEIRLETEREVYRNELRKQAKLEPIVNPATAGDDPERNRENENEPVGTAA